MKVTLTLDDDLVRRAIDLARESGRSFDEVVNDSLRRVLGVGHIKDPDQEPFRVVPKASGFKPGIDLSRLNQA